MEPNSINLKEFDLAISVQNRENKFLKDLYPY